jgi:hypothetical protein
VLEEPRDLIIWWILMNRIAKLPARETMSSSAMERCYSEPKSRSFRCGNEGNVTLGVPTTQRYSSWSNWGIALTTLKERSNVRGFRQFVMSKCSSRWSPRSSTVSSYGEFIRDTIVRYGQKIARKYVDLDLFASLTWVIGVDEKSSDALLAHFSWVGIFSR